MNPSSSASRKGATTSHNIIIDMTGVEPTRHRTEKPGAIRKKIDDALAVHEATKTVESCGTSRNPKDSNKFQVYLQSEDEVSQVRQHSEWLASGFPGARLQAPQWDPVCVDSVYNFAVLHASWSTRIKEDAAKQIGEENGMTINKIQWLSKITRRA